MRRYLLHASRDSALRHILPDMPLYKHLIISLALLLCSFGSSANAEAPTSECSSKPATPLHSASDAQQSFSDRVVNEIQVICSVLPPNGIGATAAGSAPPTSGTSDDVRVFESILNLLVGIAWPVAAVVIAYHFKLELAALLARLKSVKAGVAEAEFERGVVEAVQAAEVDQGTVPIADADPLRSTVKLDPRGTILSEWLKVEQAVFELAEKKGLGTQTSRPSRNVLGAIKAIQSAGVLDSNLVGLFHDLRALRNAAAHRYEFSPEPSAVVQYAELARALTSEINSVLNMN